MKRRGNCQQLKACFGILLRGQGLTRPSASPGCSCSTAPAGHTCLQPPLAPQTYWCPENTSCDSSGIFQSLTVPSRPPAVTQHSLLRLSSPVMTSWCPNLEKEMTKSCALCPLTSPGSLEHPLEGSAGFPRVLQGLHVCVLCHVPDLDTAVVGGTVQLVGALSEGQALGTDGHTQCDTRAQQ